MNETTRSQMWSVLSEAFGSILRTLQNTVPSAKMQMGQHQNATTLYWAYAEYSAHERKIVACFNIQAREKKIHFSGDISHENGVILKDVMDATIDDTSEAESGIVEATKQFASNCKLETSLIELK